MKNLSILYVLAITLSFVAGCNKNSGDTPPPAQIYLLSVLKTTNNGKVADSAVYKYDAQNKVIEVIDVPNQTTDVKYTYDSNDRLTEIDTYQSGIIAAKKIYTYNAGSINQQINGYTGSVLSNTLNTVITLNPSQQITKISFTSNDYNTYTYDASGNQATYNQFISGTTGPYVTHTYTYDTHPSPFTNVKGNFYVSGNFDMINNIKSETVTAVTPPSTTYSYNYNYVYNSDGFPLTRTSTVTGISDPHTVVNYTYITK